MKTFAKFVFLASLCFICVNAIGPEWHAAKITVHVSDDAGNAVSGIKINASTWGRHIPGDNFGTDKDKTVTGKTDKNGFVTFSTSCALDHGTVSMGLAFGPQFPLNGYYGNRGGIQFTNVIRGKWQPWNPVLELRLDRILNPVPMYAKKVRDVKIPREVQPVGYDLLVGDWVAPDGKGKTADLLFTFIKKTNGTVLTDPGRIERQVHDNLLTISFSNDGDGLQSTAATSSELRLQREAPTNGYSPKLIKRDFDTVTNIVVWASETKVVRHSDFNRNANYFFRVRTKTDANGNITNALYGKLYGDFNQESAGRFDGGKLSFIYYVNPEPNSRNMEYDPKQNLFLMAADKEVKTLEEARNKLWREKQQRLDEAGEKAIRDAIEAMHKVQSSCQYLSP